MAAVTTVAIAAIASHTSIGQHPKTKKAARLLGVPSYAIVGLLHNLWHWATAYAPDGDLTGLEHQDIADGCGWDGDADALIAALVDCRIRPDGAGFLEAGEGGATLEIHDWYDYVSDPEQINQAAASAVTSSPSSTASMSSTDRVRRHREKKRDGVQSAPPPPSFVASAASVTPETLHETRHETAETLHETEGETPSRVLDIAAAKAATAAPSSSPKAISIPKAAAAAAAAESRKAPEGGEPDAGTASLPDPSSLPAQALLDRAAADFPRTDPHWSPFWNRIDARLTNAKTSPAGYARPCILEHYKAVAEGTYVAPASSGTNAAGHVNAAKATGWMHTEDGQRARNRYLHDVPASMLPDLESRARRELRLKFVTEDTLAKHMGRIYTRDCQAMRHADGGTPQ